jgi:hypothetical protein
MTAFDKQLAGDVDLDQFVEALGAEAGLPLVFHYDGKPVKPGYHVTEVKVGKFSGLDCGANPEAWTEIFVQLWDIDEGDRSHMQAGKFCSIIRKVSDHVRLDEPARLTFEVSDGIMPMQLYRAETPSPADGIFNVTLHPLAASCKPRDRWLEQQSAAKAAGCCSAPAAKQACC